MKGLVHHAQVFAAPGGGLIFFELVDRDIACPDFTGGEVVGGGDHVYQGGLAGAGFAEDADQFAGENVKIDPGQSREFAGRGLIGFADADQSDQRFAQFAIGDSAVMNFGDGFDQFTDPRPFRRFEPADLAKESSAAKNERDGEKRKRKGRHS